MKLRQSGVLLRLLVLLLFASPSAAVVNFVPFFFQFFNIDALFGTTPFGGITGAALLLAGIAAGQYGFLPINVTRVVRKLEMMRKEVRMKQRGRPYQGLRSRSQRDLTFSHELLLDRLITALQILDEGMKRYGRYDRKQIS